MDTGDGQFKMLEKQVYEKLLVEKPDRQDLFYVGEEVTIKESKFRILKITPKKMTLRILPRS